jgi:hypothetical protein
MLTVVWNPRGFHLIGALAKSRKFKAVYCVTEILSPLSQWRSAGAKGNERKIVIHADNARPHTPQLSAQFFEQNRMKVVPHRPHSPDLPPSDFYLLGHVKGSSAGLWFDIADELLEAVQGVLESVEQVTLQAVFLEWMDRLRKCIATNWEYTD